MNYMQQTTLRTISTTAINNGTYFHGPKSVPPRENILKKWYKPRKFFLTGDDKAEAELLRMHKNPRKPYKKKPNIFGEYGKPLCKGVIIENLIRKPRKPNSANRKCVRVRLSTGKIGLAYIPGEGHNLQEHNVVLLRSARLRDTPNVWMKCIRGAYDLPHVIKKKQE